MSKSSTSGKTSQQQIQNMNGSATPNNLPALQQGWNVADNLVGQTAPQGTALAQTGLNLTGTGATAASGATTAGLNTATDLANGGTTNAANQYLTPFANGSMTGQQNPAFQDVLNQFAQGTQAATDGGFGASGRYGSGANANAFNGAVANEAGQLGYQNFAQQQQNQLTAGAQLSTNNANSSGQAIQALNSINPLSTAATGAGAVATATGNTPALTFAQILQALGAGGGTTSQSGSASGTGTSSSQTSGIDLGSILKAMIMAPTGGGE